MLLLVVVVVVVVVVVCRSGSDEDYTVKHQLLTDVIEQINSKKEEERKEKEHEAERKRKISTQPSTSNASQKGKFATMDIRLENMHKGQFLN